MKKLLVASMGIVFSMAASTELTAVQTMKTLDLSLSNEFKSYFKSITNYAVADYHFNIVQQDGHYYVSGQKNTFTPLKIAAVTRKHRNATLFVGKAGSMNFYINPNDLVAYFKPPVAN
jgi:uncharacterized protein YbcV (DUF1398 family)